MKSFFCFFLCAVSGIATGQDQMTGMLDPVPEHLYYRVKQLDEFFTRFNNEDDNFSAEYLEGTTNYHSRSMMIAALFDTAILRNRNILNFGKQFIHEVANDSISLGYSDNNWFCYCEM